MLSCLSPAQAVLWAEGGAQIDLGQGGEGIEGVGEVVR